MNDKAVCRTAPATPGLSITLGRTLKNFYKFKHFPISDVVKVVNFIFLSDEVEHFIFFLFILIC